MTKPVTHQGDLAKLPRALVPLLERKQWCIWRWTLKPDGSWQKPPFIATQPDRHASTSDPNTWADYTTALVMVQTGNAMFSRVRRSPALGTIGVMPESRSEM